MSDIELDILGKLDEYLNMMGEELEKEYPDIKRLRAIFRLIQLNSERIPEKE